MRASPENRVPAPRRLGLRDLVVVGAGGLATRRLRTGLSALGVAIGIAAIVAVLGISSSSKADLLAQLDRLGTNLLTVAPGQTFGGQDAVLPTQSTGMIRRVQPVQQAAAVAAVPDAAIYRNDHIPAGETGGLSVAAADLRLLEAVGATVASGSWLNAATARYPTTVLGAATAAQLGIDRIGSQIWLGGRWFTIVGILDRSRSRPNWTGPRCSACPPPSAYSAPTAPPPPSTCAPTPTRSPTSKACWPPPPTPNTPTRSRSAAPPTPWPPKRPPRARSTRCCWAWARSRCWSAGSASPT
jgi:putative ABC transport system permease protein